MKILAFVLAAVALAGCCSEPVVQLQSPISFGARPASVPGPSYVMVPQAMAPSYTVAPGACSCAPGFVMPPSAPAPAAQPCP